MNNIISKGTPVENKSNANLFTKPRRGCYEFKKGSKKYYVDVVLGHGKDINKAKEIMLSHIPLYSSLNGDEAPPGTYLWVYTDAGLAFNPVYSQFEFGTLHDNLARRIGAKVVYLAGEIEKSRAGLYTYNILSGSYMVPLMFKCTGVPCKDVQLKIMKRAEDLFRDALNGKIIYSPITFIKAGLTPVTEEEIDMYLAAGYDIYYFSMKKICDMARETGDYSSAVKIDVGVGVDVGVAPLH